MGKIRVAKLSPICLIFLGARNLPRIRVYSVFRVVVFFSRFRRDTKSNMLKSDHYATSGYTMSPRYKLPVVIYE